MKIRLNEFELRIKIKFYEKLNNKLPGYFK